MDDEGLVNGEGADHAPYEAQLRALFASCDDTDTDSLDRKSLIHLCNKLGLEQQQRNDLLVRLYCTFVTREVLRPDIGALNVN